MGASLNRFLRNKDLIDQAKLNSATVIGAGGIGSALIQGASIMGFKKLKVWDADILEEHNLSTTTFPDEYLGTSKAEAAMFFASKFRGKVKPYKIFWDDGYPLENKVFIGPDNMGIRKKIYNSWKQNPEREFLIDMRMGSLSLEIITVTKDADFYEESWLEDGKIPDEVCTMKHTIFAGSIAANLGLSQAFNVLNNRAFYSYIWMSLSPTSFRREHLVTPNIEEVADAASPKSIDRLG